MANILIPSFQVDHTRLKRGVYVSRVDRVGDQAVTTYDIRVVRPSWATAMDGAAAHTIEHLGATILRNGPIADRVIYFGPMGCLTGFYLILSGEPEVEKVADLVRGVFTQIRDWKDEDGIPGAKIGECGNPMYHDLGRARLTALGFVIAKLETEYSK
jgi:S-ribosylhomocysteine lyase